MFIERDDTTFDRAGTWLVLLLIATTLCTVILQDFDRPLSAQTADTEQREDSESAPEASLTVVEAVTSSVDLSVDSNYFLIDVLLYRGVMSPTPDQVMSRLIGASSSREYYSAGSFPLMLPSMQSSLPA